MWQCPITEELAVKETPFPKDGYFPLFEPTVHPCITTKMEDIKEITPETSSHLNMNYSQDNENNLKSNSTNTLTDFNNSSSEKAFTSSPEKPSLVTLPYDSSTSSSPVNLELNEINGSSTPNRPYYNTRYLEFKDPSPYYYCYYY